MTYRYLYTGISTVYTGRSFSSIASTYSFVNFSWEFFLAPQMTM